MPKTKFQSKLFPTKQKVSSKFVKLNYPLFQWGPADACLNFVYYPGETNVRQSAEFFKCPTWPSALLFLKNGLIYWLVSKDKIIKNSLIFTKKIVLNNYKREQTEKIFSKSLLMMKNIFRKIEKTDFENISNKNLISLYHQMLSQYYFFWALRAPIEMMSIGLEKNIKNELNKVKSRETKDILRILSSTSRLSFYREENKDLLKIALIKDRKDREKKLEIHKQKYFWILNNYKNTKILDKKYFEKELKKIKIKISNKKIENSIREIKRYCQKVKNEKTKIIKKYNLSQRVKLCTIYLDKSIFWQDIRKKYTLLSNHYLSLILKEISNRFFIKLNDLKFLTPLEVEYLLNSSKDKKSFLDKIKKRKQGAIFYFSEKNVKEIIDDKIKQKYFKFYIDKKIKKQKNIIKGTVANTGLKKYIQAKVKIIRKVTELNKIKEGDALITVMTSPDYIAGIKKASVIITDEGGLTCHAAIVARELNKPCIIGTKIATKVLKDGDLVEVDAKKGVVKILKRAK